MSGHPADIDSFDTFEQALREAAGHLYDPSYCPPGVLWQTRGCDRAQGPDALWNAIVRAIKELKPAADVPPAARIRRIYGLLYYRYVENLTQEEVAERLGITARHLRREQMEAIHVLARRLWPQEPGAPAADQGEEPDQAPDWHAQVKQELASLRDGAPGLLADVGETVQAAGAFGAALAARYHVSLETQRPQDGLTAPVHPAVLRQVVLAAVGDLARNMPAGKITVQVEKAGRTITLTIAGTPPPGEPPAGAGFIEEILDVPEGSVTVETRGEGMAFCISLPAVEHIVVVVDDNQDMAHLYRRYTTGTGYYVVHVAQGRRLFEVIESRPPSAIVLDVMLPDADGWALLSRLREQPQTCAIPVIVCSVVREEELAMALGATLYLRKPIQRDQFIAALDRAVSQDGGHTLSQAPTGSPTQRSSSATACAG